MRDVGQDMDSLSGQAEATDDTTRGACVRDEGYDNFVLALYRSGRERRLETFQDWAFSELENLIPFDGGFWSRAGIEEGAGRLYANHLYKLPPITIEVWGRYQDRDVLGKLALAAQGRTVNVTARDVTADPEVLDQIVSRFGLEYVLTTCIIDPLTSLISAVTVFRDAKGPPFTEAERQLMERVTPHLVEAYSANRLIRLLETRRPDSPFAYATAACDGEALLHVVSPEFAALIALEWPAWHGPKLPIPLAERLTASGKPLSQKAVFRGARILVRFEPVNELIWLRVRVKEPADELSPRETEVARLIAAGQSNKEIARSLDISPFTVRNQLNTIYGKLGIASRAGLAALLGEFE